MLRGSFFCLCLARSGCHPAVREPWIAPRCEAREAKLVVDVDSELILNEISRGDRYRVAARMPCKMSVGIFDLNLDTSVCQ